MALIARRFTLPVGILGVILAIAGFVVYLTLPHRTIAIAALEAAAVACLTIFLITHFELLQEFSRRRPVRMGVKSLLKIALFAVILGIINFLAARHDVRWDFSETRRFTLAPQTARALQELPRDVKVTVFKNEKGQYGIYKDLLENYQARSSKVAVEFVDPDKKPGLARRYGITRLDTAVLESGKQETRVAAPTEQEVTNALLRVTRDDKKNIYFLTGHAEHQLDDTTEAGYAFLKRALEQQGYTVRALSLYESKIIPADASLLIVGGPQRPVLEQEQALIADYVKRGGRLLVMLDPGSKAGLEGLMANWGLKMDARIVLDEQKILSGDLTMPVVSNYGTHEITHDLGSLLTVFPDVRPIMWDDSKTADWEFHALAKSSTRSWASPEHKGRVRFDPAKDAQGPFTVAAVVTARKEPAENARRPAIVALGDSDLASNAFLNLAPGNNDFILHAVAWLAEEKGLVTIAPKDTGFATFLVTPSQAAALLALQVFAVPTACLIAGIVLWRHRRRL
jgi:ABC-type uncharacterized transport system involved in gliding motility auxiliary subunit